MAENGKIRFPKSGNPSIPPPTGSFYTWLSTEGLFKKMDDQGNVTNLSVQSLQDLTEMNVTGATDGQILVFNGSTNVWESADFPEDNIYDYVRMKSSNGSVWKLSVNDSGSVVVSPD